MRYLSGCSLIAAIGLSFVAFGCPSPDPEPNNKGDTITNGDSLQTGDSAPSCAVEHGSESTAIEIATFEGYVSSDQKVCVDSSVFYVFTLAEDSIISINLDGFTGNDLDLRLSSGDRSTASDDAPETIETVLEAGEYYIEVEGYDVTTAGGAPFTLTVGDVIPSCKIDSDCTAPQFCEYFIYGEGYLGGRCSDHVAPATAAIGPEDTPNDSYHRASAVTAANGTATYKMAGYDVDVFKIVLATVGSIQVTATATDLESYVILFDEAGDIVDYNSFVPTGAEPVTTFTINHKFVLPGTFYLYVTNLAIQDLVSDFDDEGSYTLTFNTSTTPCAEDTECLALDQGRQTCILAAGDPPATTAAQVGACINYTPASPVARGAFCDDDEDCAGTTSACYNPSALSHEDNMCTIECDEADDCTTGTEYCSYWAGLCVPHCTVGGDDCSFGTMCNVNNLECTYAECRLSDTCTSLFGAEAECSLSQSNGSLFQGCAVAEAVETCNSDDQYEGNNYPEEAAAINVGTINALDCAAGIDYYTFSASANSAKDLAIKLVGSDLALFRMLVIDELTGNKFGGSKLKLLADGNLEHTQIIQNIAPAQKLRIVVSRQPKLIEDGYIVEDTGSIYAASAYTLTLTESTAALPCDSIVDCATDATPRPICDDGACLFDDTLTDYMSDANERCMNYMDCNLQDNFDLDCSRTRGAPASNFCSTPCFDRDDCATDLGGLAANYVCTSDGYNPGLCAKLTCATDAECPAGDDIHKVCTSTNKCGECIKDADCSDANYDICSATYNTCGRCKEGDNSTCAGQDSGSACIMIEDDFYGTFAECLCKEDTHCATSEAGLACVLYSGEDFGVCSCVDDEDCPNGLICTEDWLTGEPFCGTEEDGF